MTDKSFSRIKFTKYTTFKIGDFAEVKGGKRLPVGEKFSETTTDHPYLRIVDFKSNGIIDTASLQFIEESVFNKISRYIISVDDLYISIVGTIGLVGSIPPSLDGANLTENAAKICNINSNIINKKYLEYYLRSTIGQEEIRKLSVGSTQAKLALFRILQISVPCPSLVIQNSIVQVLNSLEERIKILHEMNSTLENTAQTIFRSWFMDFDPVHAKAEGREPEGMDAGTAALFPDGFEESELGLIPKGWSIAKIEQVLELAYGKALKATDRIFGSVPVYGSGGVTGYHNEALINEPSIIVGRKGTVGSLYWEDQPFFPIDTVFYVKAKVPLTYCYYLLQTLGLTEMNTDGAVPGLNRNNVYRLKIAMGSNEIIQAFDNAVMPLRKKISYNLEHINILIKLRDNLLPRLISGELTLAESEKVLRDYA
ncbi:restriction endonuclease subunit S [Legionella hackeliae]|uniref:Restriction modification system, type I n=1 Tax=Legionella hackeliae TaxID=449 RepID=A0A0A8UU47_LEGHA|nr:restriction endonuclease subunit S [Legionella hackeliae]KTD09637.1 EcoKI restriction-modification system protein HsdS [Legionella hackeliae]CEK11046.1 Restriction modification system, type I [Legionella hackeliae]STX47790.1 EcoKI restriction-modification system protein HsdS [Legionella hackeliae]